MNGPELRVVTLDAERDFHNNRFEGEDSRSSFDRYYRALYSCFKKYKQRRRELAKGKYVLEYGCATGSEAMSLSRVAHWITGIDISDTAIYKARKTAAWEGCTNTDFNVLDAHATGLPAESYSLIYGSGILHHLDCTRAYAELRRVLKEDGSILFIEPLDYKYDRDWETRCMSI